MPRFALLLAVVSFALAGCGDDDTKPATPAKPYTTPPVASTFDYEDFDWSRPYHREVVAHVGNGVVAGAETPLAEVMDECGGAVVGSVPRYAHDNLLLFLCDPAADGGVRER